MPAIETIADGILQIDTLLGGWERMTAGFLVVGDRPALVETGAQTSAAAVREALASVGLGADDLAWIVLTHIHLDHGGAVGDLARDFPAATVVVHPRGAPHLADPTRLVESAGRVYGPLLDSLYGRMTPVEPERLVAAPDGYVLDIGRGRRLRLVESPGHAKHHHAVLDEQTGTLLVGDAVGVRLPDMPVLRPAAPPPDFDLEQAVASLHRFAELRPSTVVLTHYGPVPDPSEALTVAEEELHRWVAVAERVLAASAEAGVEDVAAALAEAFAPPVAEVPPEHREKLEILNGIHSNAAGIHRYLVGRASGAPPHA